MMTTIGTIAFLLLVELATGTALTTPIVHAWCARRHVSVTAITLPSTLVFLYTCRDFWWPWALLIVSAMIVAVDTGARLGHMIADLKAAKEGLLARIALDIDACRCIHAGIKDEPLPKTSGKTPALDEISYEYGRQYRNLRGDVMDAEVPHGAI